MKLALLKNVSFDPFGDKLLTDTSFIFDNKNYELYISDKLEYHEFENSKDLFTKISTLINNSVEIFNCYYDKEYLIQSFYINTESIGYENILFVKRKININDSYTFLEFSETSEIDLYNYVDITMSDLVKIFKNKYVINGVLVKSNGEIKDVEFIRDYSNDSNIHSIIFNETSELSDNSLKYLDVKNIINKIYSDNSITDHDESINKIMQEEINKHSLNYIYTQKNIDFCILDYYAQIIGFDKNNIMSELLKDDIYGDIIINLENSLDDDHRILNTNSDLFLNMYNCIKSKVFKRKNNLYFNIFYEFL